MTPSLRSSDHRLESVLRALAGLPEGLRILLGSKPHSDQPRLYYGFANLPQPMERTSGGITKMQLLERPFPNSPRKFNILYMVSSRMPRSAEMLASFSQRRGAHFLWNQNGVAYPAWHPAPGWEHLNARMAILLRRADYAVYQSEFCRKSADRFLGARKGPFEILHNSVDTRHFVPSAADPAPGKLVLLLAGTQMQKYRVMTALQVIKQLRSSFDAKLMIAGALTWAAPDQARQETALEIRRLQLEEHIEFTGPYSQTEAPALYQRAHLLLHTKYNDPCPTVVLEAMACGLPVVYSASGGTSELVGPSAGVGVPSPESWEQDYPPDPEALAQASATVAASPKQFGLEARKRAVELFDSSRWVSRHKELFERLLKQ